LDGRTYQPYDNDIFSLNERYSCAYARGLCLYLLDALDKQFILAINGSSETVSHNFVSLRTVAANFLAQQSVAILDYKRVAEECGMHGAVHCTSLNIRKQVESCLTTWPECADAFQVYTKASHKSMDWASDRQYRLLPKPFIAFHGNLFT
jgi:hypothetical protein